MHFFNKSDLTNQNTDQNQTNPQKTIGIFTKGNSPDIGPQQSRNERKGGKDNHDHTH